jgi:peptide/nickel transport system permease protein
MPCGIVSAVWRGRAGRPGVQRGFAMLAASVPSFWLGLMLIQVFAVRLGWFPVSGYGDPGASLAASACTTSCCRPRCWGCSTRR